MKLTPVLLLPLLLAACATPGRPSGALSSYDGLEPKDGAVRTSIAERSDDAALAKVKRVFLEPARLAEGEATEWLDDGERTLLLREIDAQVCFELTERYALAGSADAADARVRTIVTRVEPTGRVGSTLSAAAGFFIPGPIGLRVPGETGGLGAEAEMLRRDGRQLAAVVWNRNATPVGTDDPSLSRLGDALQFAEPFADAVGAAMTAEGAEGREIEDPDPCALYGPRFRPEGWLAKFVTGFYVPAMSGAKPEAEATDRKEAAE
ncbi:MAG: DUF3313 domain-containing protein [Pseudomonadota bacterium]